MHKKTLNILSVCIFVLIIVFSFTQKNKLGLNKFSDNIIVDENGKVLTKADQYKTNILETVSEENIKNFKKFSKAFEKNSGDNITDNLSKDIFTQYIKYNTYGEIKDSEIVGVTQSVLKNKVDLEHPIYINEIKTNISSVENLKIYSTNVAIILNSLNNGLKSINKKDKTPYVTAAYRGAAKLLTQIEVPEILASNHLQMANGYIKYSEGLEMLRQQNSDPAKALLGLNKIQSATEELTLSFDKIKKTIILNKVTYTDNDPGLIWLSTETSDTSIKIQ